MFHVVLEGIGQTVPIRFLFLFVLQDFQLLLELVVKLRVELLRATLRVSSVAYTVDVQVRLEVHVVARQDLALMLGGVAAEHAAEGQLIVVQRGLSVELGVFDDVLDVFFDAGIGVSEPTRTLLEVIVLGKNSIAIPRR